MPNRYWIGNSGNINDSAHWSDTDGGTGGASVPTSVDDIFFTSNSFNVASTITFNVSFNCLSMSWTDIGFAILWTVSQDISVYGDLLLHNNVSLSTNIKTLFFKAIDSRTITTNNVNLNINLNFNGVNGSWTVLDNITCLSITATNGSIDTNNVTVNCTVLNTSTGTKTINLGNSIVNCSAVNFNPTANLTFNCGTSTINIDGGTIFHTASKVYYNVNITLYNFNFALSLSATFNNLTLIGTDNYNCLFTLGASLIINNLFTITGYSPTKRVSIFGGSLGNRYSITSANNNFINCDFRDINGLGTGNWNLSSGEFGNCGNNLNITFRDGINKYYYGASGSFTDDNWYTEPNGGGVKTTIPLGQDTAIFNENSIPENGSLTLNLISYGGLDFLNTANNITITLNSNIVVKGNLAFNPTTIISGNYSISMFYHTGTINLNNVTLYSLGFASYSNYTCLSDIYLNSVTSCLSFGNGSFNLNGFNLELEGYVSIGGTGARFNMGSGIITSHYTNASTSAIGSVYSNIFNCTQATIILDPAYPTGNVLLWIHSYTKIKKLIFKNSNTGILKFKQNHNIEEFIVEKGKTFYIDPNFTLTCDKITLNSELGYPITIGTNGAGTSTLAYTGTNDLQFNYLNISNSISSSGKLYAGYTSTDGGGNTGWIFGEIFLPIQIFYNYCDNRWYEPETLTQYSRILSDGGSVVDLYSMNTFIAGLKTLGLYNNLLACWDARFGVKKDGSNAVSKLYDLSSYNRDASQLTGSYQPIWESNVWNDRSAILFDGGDYLDLLGMTFSNHSVVISFNKLGGGTAREGLASGSDGYRLVVESNAFRVQRSVTNLYYGPISPDNTWMDINYNLGGTGTLGRLGEGAGIRLAGYISRLYIFNISLTTDQAAQIKLL